MMYRQQEEFYETTNRMVEWRIRRGYLLYCAYDKPHHLCNDRRKQKPDRYKSHRRNYGAARVLKGGDRG